MTTYMFNKVFQTLIINQICYNCLCHYLEKSFNRCFEHLEESWTQPSNVVLLLSAQTCPLSSKTQTV